MKASWWGSGHDPWLETKLAAGTCTCSAVLYRTFHNGCVTRQCSKPNRRQRAPMKRTLCAGVENGGVCWARIPCCAWGNVLMRASCPLSAHLTNSNSGTSVKQFRPSARPGLHCPVLEIVSAALWGEAAVSCARAEDLPRQTELCSGVPQGAEGTHPGHIPPGRWAARPGHMAEAHHLYSGLGED